MSRRREGGECVGKGRGAWVWRALCLRQAARGRAPAGRSKSPNTRLQQAQLQTNRVLNRRKTQGTFLTNTNTSRSPLLGDRGCRGIVDRARRLEPAAHLGHTHVFVFRSAAARAQHTASPALAPPPPCASTFCFLNCCWRPTYRWLATSCASSTPLRSSSRKQHVAAPSIRTTLRTSS